MLIQAVVSVVLFSAVLADDPFYLTVQLPDGLIHGHSMTSFWGGTYSAFQEIPYAAPPVGADRFKPPRTPDPWNGTLETTQNTKQCFQTGDKAEPYEQTEDCLYLNVYTPQIPGSTTLLPVVVWIHGGAFMGGNGNIIFNNPARYMDAETVLVTINYRLGALGFLTSMDGTIPGNLGLKDQRFAIEWVKRNINLFGGHPDKIVIAGASAGAHSVGYQLVGRNATGLFAGAIQESGSSLCTSTFTLHARKYAFDLGQVLDPNFSSEDSSDLLDLLNKHTGAEIIAASQKVPSLEGNTTGYIPGMMWLPVIEDETKDSTALITAPPFESFKNGKFAHVPFVVGFNSEESLAFKDDSNPANAEIAKLYDDHPETMLDGVKLSIPAENLTAAAQEITQIYTKTSFSEDNGAYVRYSTDSGFTFGILKQAELASKYVKSYVYQFSYVGVLAESFAPFGRFDIKGCGKVGHGEELAYTWNQNTTEISSDDLYTSARLLQIYKNFALWLDPTLEAQSILDNIQWPVVGHNPIYYEFVDIDKYVRIMDTPRNYQKVNEVFKKYIVGPYS